MKRILTGVLLLLCCLGVLAKAAEQQSGAVDLAKIKELNIETAQAVALAGNPSMAAALARVEQARARVQQATATWWPSLDLNGTSARQRLSENSYQYNQAIARALGQTTDQNLNNYGAGIQATWALFDGFYRNFKQQQAQYGELSADAAMNDSRRLLMTTVAEAFLNAQSAQTAIDIAHADETFYARQLEDAQNRFKVGAGPWGDVLNIKVQINSAKTNLIRSQREFEAAGYGLAALLGLPDAAFPPHIRLESLDKIKIQREHEENTEALITEALALRPDVRRLEMEVKQAEAASGMARAPLYPKVQLSGKYEGGREGNAGLGRDDFGNTVGVNMSWNFYAGGADKARLIEAEQAKREATYTLAGLRHSVTAEIRQNVAALASAQEQVRLQQDTVKLVQENRDLAKSEYEAGQTSLVRLNEAQRDLSTTHSRLAQALVAYRLAQQHLLAATGRNLKGVE
jgi:outer membrane protein TolC